MISSLVESAFLLSQPTSADCAKSQGGNDYIISLNSAISFDLRDIVW